MNRLRDWQNSSIFLLISLILFANLLISKNDVVTVSNLIGKEAFVIIFRNFGGNKLEERHFHISQKLVGHLKVRKDR